MNKIRIAGAIASQTGITLYLENGSELNLPKDSWRTKAILDETLEHLAMHKVVELDLDKFSIERRIEKRTNGFVRFFRKVGEALGFVHSGGVGSPPANPAEEVAASLVAVVNGKEIPGVEALERQMERAAYTDNVEGLQKFLERIATVIDERGHSVEELLNFMKRADLPIANDGSIVAYKVLSSGENGRFVDCYTRSVSQALGSHVSQEKVDPSKRTECSTGLHIARRGYLRNFGGDVITLVKIAPEDVIAVPYNEPDKMRVRAYHIVAVLPPEVHPILRANQPMTKNEVAAQILADVIAGNHVPVLEYVKIGGPMGGNVTIETVKAGTQPKAKKSGDIAKALDDQVEVSLKEIRETIDKVVEAKKAAKKSKAKAASKKSGESKKAKKDAAKTGKAKSEAPVAKKELPEKYQQALKMLADGKSLRAVERELHICRKTLRKLQAQQG